MFLEPTHHDPDTPSGKPTEQERKQRYERKRAFVRTGQAIMLAGAAMGVIHWLTHLGAFGPQPQLWLDLLAGYPMAALLLIVGAITASKK